MDKFYFDLGLDPNFRLAEDAGQLNKTTTMLRLSRFAAQYGLKGEIDAKTVPPESLAASDVNAGLALGASVLRDCYGKVNYFIASAAAPAFNDIAKLLKAYRKDIRVIAVFTEENDPALHDSVAVDETVTIKNDLAEEIAESVLVTENIN